MSWKRRKINKEGKKEKKMDKKGREEDGRGGDKKNRA